MQTIDRVTFPAPSENPLIIGVVADTHIPDRATRLPTHLIPALVEAKVSLILHAGDISIPSVMDSLRQVAPVIAVRGNRDFLMRKSLPMTATIQVGEVEIGLTHGHGSLGRYLADKVRHLRNGYRIEDYQGYLRNLFPRARAIVFGHTHYPEDRVDTDGVLLFNPGAAGKALYPGLPPSYGLLTVESTGQVSGKILTLD